VKKVSETGKHNELDYGDRAGNYIDFAEDIFEEYCVSKDMKFRRLHFNDTPDFATSPIPLWNKMHPVLKSFPDYFVYNDKEHFFCEVKANYKIKVNDLKHYNLFDSMFCENYATKYYIVFCVRGEEVVFKTVDQIAKALQNSTLDQYHDGPYYYKVRF
jgi:hypothetical protein